ncbi:MAG: DUF4397 domain-containing protein [Calditrichia bacterium]
MLNLNLKAVWSVALGLLMLVAACSDSSEPTTSTPTIPDTLKVRAMHLSYDAPAVDVFLGGSSTATFNSLTYGNATEYVQVDPGTLNVKMNQAGTSTTVIDFDAPLTDERLYTFYAIDALANLDGVFTVDERANTDTTASIAKIRLIHAVPDAPRIDFDGSFVDNNGVQRMETIALDLAFKQASFYASVDADTFSLVIRPAGDSTIVVAFEPVVLEDDAAYSVVAQGTLVDTTDAFPFEANMFIDSGNGMEKVSLIPLP